MTGKSPRLLKRIQDTRDNFENRYHRPITPEEAHVLKYAEKLLRRPDHHAKAKAAD